jgi:3'(2'), 5'-bisphosphate nucleotidase
MTNDIQTIVSLARTAGSKISKIYHSDFSVINKADNSPLTEADLISHEIICSTLALITPDVPILSEESSQDQIANRLAWQTYWLIDPLDGTKEFISGSGEFTVNIALIENGHVVLGVVYAPELDLMYWGSSEGAFKQYAQEDAKQIYVSCLPTMQEQWRIVASRSHLNEQTSDFLMRYKNISMLKMGSSLKFCLVAQGDAHLYPRLAPTCEWDSAAAQAVVEAAGGYVLEYPSLKPLRYNQRDTLLNPNFLVCSDIPSTWM